MLRYPIFLFFLLASMISFSAEVTDSVCQSSLEMENEWAKTRYQTDIRNRIQEFTALLVALNNAPLSCLNTPEYQIIAAMIKGSMAKQQSRLKAIKQVKQIKRHLDKAIKKSPSAMSGLGWTLLGLLYDKSPGWPFSIGDDEKAEQAYLKGLEYNPDGIDANFYYGDFLRRKGRIKEARKYLSKASQSKPRAEIDLAYQGRMKDVQRSLSKLAR